MSAIVTLTTDFGTQDAFVGTMKGVILSRCPDARLVDLTHEVPPQAIPIGAIRLAAAAPFFPAGTVHLAVVDPGVGGARRAIAIEARGQRFVGPDNGVLALAAQRSADDWRAVELTNPVHQLPRVSNTFHGRDIFAPAAAHLACGGDLLDLGPLLASTVELELPRPTRDGEIVRGVVQDVDRFGNLITNIAEVDIAHGDVTGVTVAATTVQGLTTWYDEAQDLVAIFDSAGFLEIAAPLGNAAALLNVRLDEPVEVRLRLRA